MSLDQITVNQIFLFIVAASTAVSAYTNIKGKWRNWLHKEIDDVKASVAHVESQMKPNGGSSLFDAVKRTEARVNELATKVDIVEELQTRGKRRDLALRNMAKEVDQIKVDVAELTRKVGA